MAEAPVETDIRARLVYVEHKIQDHKGQLAIINKWIADTNIANAAREVQWTNMLSRLDSIDGNIKWAVRLIIGGIIAGFVAFIIGGGLKHL